MSERKSLTEQSRKLEQRLSGIPAEILAALRPALMRSGEEVARNMKALVPKDTGNLADTIAATPRRAAHQSQPGQWAGVGRH